MAELSPEDVLQLRRQVRLLSILRAADSAGLSPLPLGAVHTVAYFSDALAPVWGLRILDAQLLKQAEGPRSPELQQDLDRLVGRGLVAMANVRHEQHSGNQWQLTGEYRLVPSMAAAVLHRAGELVVTEHELVFVQEIVYALASLGRLGIQRAPRGDAAYSDELIDQGGLIDLTDVGDAMNATARVASRFAVLAGPAVRLTDAEQVHLYVRAMEARLARSEVA